MLGLGLSISFPVSSQDILKSCRTDRVRDVKICGAITNLWIPKANKNTENNKFINKKNVATIESGWNT